MENCINTQTNTCYFGYGGISVSVLSLCITFKEIKPPIGAGNNMYDEECNKIGEWEYTGNKLFVSFSDMDEIDKFSDALKKIEEDKGGFFKFNNIIFDFTYYKQESMEVVKRAIKFVRRNIIPLLAC